MKTIINAAVSIFFTREKFCKARQLEDVARDWKKLELVWNVMENSDAPEVDTPEGFGYCLAAQQQVAFQMTQGPVAGETPFSAPSESVFLDTLQDHFYKAA